MYDDFLAKILEPDAYLPSQFYGNSGLSRQLEGEKRLMIAILKDAVECLEKHRVSNSSSCSDLYQNAIQWIGDKSTDWLFSFTNICDFLGFDPDYMREFLLKRERELIKSAGGRAYSFSTICNQG
ncbi:MAG: hypothetical protein ACE5HC_00255 [Candidatus Binatia bacterium]